jgi:glycosyltransferase involved in cell wall biosynthesis
MGKGAILDPPFATCSDPAQRPGVHRVLMIAPTPFFADRGCHVRIYEEARALQALGCQVEVCTYHLGDDRPGLPVHRTLRIPWYNKLSAGPSWHKLYIDVLLLFKTWAVGRRFQPDVIHGHLHEGAAIGWAVGQLLGVPVVGDIQGSLSGELQAHRFLSGHGPFHRFWAANEGWIDRLPQVTVASCSDIAAELQDRFGVRHVIVALDGVDTEVFRPDAQGGDPSAGSLVSAPGQAGEGLRALVPPGRRAVVYLGILSTYQGVDHLLEAIPHVLRRVPEAYFLIMGYPDEEQYRQKARDLGVAESVSLPGRIDYNRAPGYLALGEVAVGPKLSVTESNGKLYNYMACGLPTVAFDTPPSREILGDLGIYAPWGDTAALADGIAGLLEDPVSARQLGKKLRQRVIDQYSWRNTARRLMEAYALASAQKPNSEGPITIE